MKQTFRKSERLHSKKLIEELFESGKSIRQSPYVLRYLWHPFEKGEVVQIAISIPKKNVRRAVDRNRLKRQLREAYRLNKERLISRVAQQDKGLALFLIYTGKEKENYKFLEDKLKVLLQEVEKLVQ